MPQTYTAVIRRSDEWWIGTLEEIPGVNAQAHTREELIEDLKAALADMLELNKADAISDMDGEYEEISISL